MRLLGERSTSGKKVTLKTTMNHSNICQLGKQLEEIEKAWVEEGGKSAVSCVESQMKRISIK